MVYCYICGTEATHSTNIEPDVPRPVCGEHSVLAEDLGYRVKEIGD